MLAGAAEEEGAGLTAQRAPWPGLLCRWSGSSAGEHNQVQTAASATHTVLSSTNATWQCGTARDAEGRDAWDGAWDCVDGCCHSAGERGMVCLQAASKAEVDTLPSEAALVRQPSVAAAVHQTLLDMPGPPLAGPLSDSSSGSRDLTLSEGASHMVCSSLSCSALSFTAARE